MAAEIVMMSTKATEEWLWTGGHFGKFARAGMKRGCLLKDCEV